MNNSILEAQWLATSCTSTILTLKLLLLPSLPFFTLQPSVKFLTRICDGARTLYKPIVFLPKFGFLVKQKPEIVIELSQFICGV